MPVRPVIISLLVLLLFACNGDEVTSYTYNTNPAYTKGYQLYYGQEYLSKGIDKPVISLTLLTDSMHIDSTGTLSGTGQYLSLPDIFLPSTEHALVPGTYTVDTTANAYTIRPGKDLIVGNQKFPVGAFIYYYEQSANRSLRKYITGGTMRVNQYGDGHYYIAFSLITSDKNSLNGSCSAALDYYDFGLMHTRTLAPRLPYPY